MDKLLLLRGKLEMAKRTIQLQKTSFAKKLAGAKSTDKGGEVLVYKDAPDADSSEEDAGDDADGGEDQGQVAARVDSIESELRSLIEDDQFLTLLATEYMRQQQRAMQQARQQQALRAAAAAGGVPPA